MSLYRQLVMLITLFLVFILGISLWFILNNDKNLIEDQMSSSAKNSATFLGLSISKNVDLEDTATLDGMISSIVDNGFYEYIAIVNNDSKEIIKLSSPRETALAPKWFTNTFYIDAPSSEANIMKGWLNVGTIEVKIHQDYANNVLWKTFKSMFQIFVFSTIILLIIFYMFLNKLLKPLRNLSAQAKAIDNNEFIIEKTLPNTIEFKNVVQAMNKTILKMETIFNKEVETLNKYNELLYKDDDTKLGNKKYLLLKLNSFLKNSHGLLVFIDLKDEVSFKKKVGFKKYFDFEKHIISLVNENLLVNKNVVFSKLNDGVLSVLLPNIHYEDIQSQIETIYKDIYKYVKDENLDEYFEICVSIGISNYVQDSSTSDILTKTDQSLTLAMQKNKKINYLEKDVLYSKSQWIELLEWAFKNNGLIFHSQNILDIQTNKVFMQEYFTRLKDKEGKIYTPGDFWSIVSSMGWMPKLEKELIKKIFDKYSKINTKENAVINLTTEFVCNKQSVQWLISLLKNEFTSSNTIFHFECINADILENLEAYEYLSKELSKTNHRFAIESFTFDNENLDYLKVLKPAYLKISKSYLMEKTNSITDSVLLNISSTIGAYLIVKHVETKEEYTHLKSINIKYLQGKFIDTIEDN